jgi:hypothetical protein
MVENPSFTHTEAAALGILRHGTGVVIPVYLPEGIDAARGAELLRETVQAYCAQVEDPATICLSVDGHPFGAAHASRLAEEFGTSIYVAPANRGKLQAAAHGVRVLLERQDTAYVAIVDQDGDHFANELPNLIRVARHVAAHTGNDRCLVLGRRVSRHRPMGFLRGELEELADRILLDALLYRSAIDGQPLRLEYVYALDEFPDFHSGYKLFSRSIAGQVFLGEPQMAGVSEACYYRHACEAVMVVEALEHGAYLGVVNRSTLNEQPISTFGLFNLSQLVADKIIWPCKRLGVPLLFVRQWMANHIPRLLLHTLAPDGKAELERIRRIVIAAWDEDQAADPEPTLQPLFV